MGVLEILRGMVLWNKPFFRSGHIKRLIPRPVRPMQGGLANASKLIRKYKTKGKCFDRRRVF